MPPAVNNARDSPFGAADASYLRAHGGSYLRSRSVDELRALLDVLSPAVAASESRWHAAADPIERDPGGSSCRLVLDALSSDRVKFTQLTVRGDDIRSIA